MSLVEEGVDLAMRNGELTDSALIAQKIATTPVITIASPAFTLPWVRRALRFGVLERFRGAGRGAIQAPASVSMSLRSAKTQHGYSPVTAGGV